MQSSTINNYCQSNTSIVFGYIYNTVLLYMHCTAIATKNIMAYKIPW